MHIKDVSTWCTFKAQSSIIGVNWSLVVAVIFRFLNWIPLGYIFETKLIHMLVMNFLPVPLFRNVTLKCLTEIAGVTVSNYPDMFRSLFNDTMVQLEVMLPLTTDIRMGYAVGGDQEQNFIQNLAMFLCTFLREHGNVAEANLPVLKKALHYLVLISRVEDVEIFKICLEYWNTLATKLYREMTCGVPTPLAFGDPQPQGPQMMFVLNKKEVYNEVSDLH